MRQRSCRLSVKLLSEPETPAMKRFLTLFGQTAVALVGLAALTFLLWAPRVDGANAHATVFKIYFQDPFVAYVYAASVPFFFGLRRAFRLLGHILKHGVSSQATVDHLRAIRRCAFWILGAVPGGLAFILSGEPEPPGIVMSLFVALVAGLVATGATLLTRAAPKRLPAGKAP